MLLKIETYTIMMAFLYTLFVAFLITISVFFIVSYIAAHAAAEEEDLEKLETEDERIHEEWSKENTPPYLFVHCPGDTNTYPEGTKCNDDDDDDDDDDDEEED